MRTELGVCAMLVTLAACHATGPSTPPGHSPAVAIHTVSSSPAGISANGYLVEGPTAVVAIDSALTLSEAAKVRARLEALGKPLAAVLLTHGHPDHYNGVASLIAGRDVPIYATAAVASVIRAHDSEKAAQWTPMFGDEWPKQRAFPNHELADGQSLDIDGLRFTVHELGPGESHADSYWSLANEAAFIGDVVLYGEHAYLSDGHSTQWLANIARLEHELAGVHRLYPGHGAAGGLELLRWQRDYLLAYRAQVERLRAGQTQLSAAQKEQLVASMKQSYPQAGLEFLISLGADPVASELASVH
jgi:glyoxylase-like metal-dependent hydrolase (beta-lactamase superfamily II)